MIAEPEQRDSETPSVSKGWIIAGISVFVFLFSLPALVLFFSKAEVTQTGAFGDTYGVLNALFSAMAFAGVIISLLMQRQELRLQRKELSLQREELSLTREELKKSAKAQEQSAVALAKQAESLLLAAELNSINARIEVYHSQIDELAKLPGGLTPDRNDRFNRMREERFNLYLCIDQILEKLHPGAKGIPKRNA